MIRQGIDAKAGSSCASSAKAALRRWPESIWNDPSGNMRPGDPITRQELAAVLGNYSKKVGGSALAYDPDRLYKYPDRGSISAWAKDSVGWCVEKGIMGGSAALNPLGGASRAEAAKMILVFSEGGSQQPALMKAHFIDVGQGDSVFLELADGSTVLIDAGPSGAGAAVASYIRGLGYTGIGTVVMTHPDADHVGGMVSVLNSFDIGKVYAPNASNNTITWENVLDALIGKGLPINLAYAGVDISTPSASLAFSLPGSSATTTNDASAVLLARYGSTRFLFTGDADAGDLAACYFGNIDVLKVSHHGSATGTSSALMATMRPANSVISVGANNSYGHPAPGVLSRLQASGSTIYRTDQLGTVIAFSDSTAVWFSAKDSSPIPDPSPSPTPTAGTTVYWTPSGAKYHLRSCATIKNSATLYSGTIDEALATGRTACKVCEPS